MMIRGLTISVLFAVLALPAYAQDSTPEAPQDNPQTRQTDEDEDAYRRSQRRRDTGDIFEDIDINTNGFGGGGLIGPEVKAIDRLDQESRRHLNKERAKALAEAAPGERIDAAYEPSEAAKTDEYIAKQEEEAWGEMIREANAGIGVTQGPLGGQGQGQGQSDQGQGGQGQSGQGQSGQGQGGQASQGQPGQSSGPSRAPSVIRGGSSSSASAILDQIKGRSGGGGTSPQGQNGGGQSGQGQSQGQGSQAGQNPFGSGQQSGSQSGQSQSGQSQSGQEQSGSGQSGSTGSSNSTASILDQILGGAGGSTFPQGQAPQSQTGQNQTGQNQTGQNQTGQDQTSQGTQQVQGPLGQLPSQSQNQGDTSERGGSATSASAILNQIRGFGGGAQQGQAPSGTGNQGTVNQGTSQTQGQTQQAQNQTQPTQTGQSESGQNPSQPTFSSQGQNPAEGTTQAAADAAANAATDAAVRQSEPLSPLELINRAPVESSNTGGSTSASDYLNRGK